MGGLDLRGGEVSVVWSCTWQHPGAVQFGQTDSSSGVTWVGAGSARGVLDDVLQFTFRRNTKLYGFVSGVKPTAVSATHHAMFKHDPIIAAATCTLAKVCRSRGRLLPTVLASTLCPRILVPLIAVL